MRAWTKASSNSPASARIFRVAGRGCKGILGDQIQVGDIVPDPLRRLRAVAVCEMLYPTSYVKSKGLGKACALITDGHLQRHFGLSIGHVSPEAAEGAIGLVEEGDMIDIDIPNRTINVRVSDAELAARRDAMDAKRWRRLEAGQP
ncbi:MAG: dihydroxy-acid dehydratase [Thiothrix sp.]